MTARRRFNSVLAMTKCLTDDQTFHADLEKEIANKRLAKTLFAMRCSEGISPEEMASRLDWPVSEVERIEGADIDGIRVSELVAYTKALGLRMSIAFHRKMTAVECVKFHVFQIKRHLDHLAKLAHRDDALLEGVRKFYAEYLANVLRLFRDSVGRLPGKAEEKQSVLDVSTPAEVDKEEELLLGLRRNG